MAPCFGVCCGARSRWGKGVRAGGPVSRGGAGVAAVSEGGGGGSMGVGLQSRAGQSRHSPGKSEAWGHGHIIITDLDRKGIAPCSQYTEQAREHSFKLSTSTWRTRHAPVSINQAAQPVRFHPTQGPCNPLCPGLPRCPVVGCPAQLTLGWPSQTWEAASVSKEHTDLPLSLFSEHWAQVHPAWQQQRGGLPWPAAASMYWVPLSPRGRIAAGT
eukprot:1155892-Pelagomonas_calceolata.AAC.4